MRNKEKFLLKKAKVRVNSLDFGEKREFFREGLGDFEKEEFFGRAENYFGEKKCEKKLERSFYSKKSMI